MRLGGLFMFFRLIARVIQLNAVTILGKILYKHTVF